MASCKSIRAEGGLNLSCSLSFMSCLKRPFSGRCVSIFSLKFVGVAVWVAVQHSSSLHYGLPFTAHQQLPTLHTEISSSPKSGVSSWTNLPMTLQKC